MMFATGVMCDACNAAVAKKMFLIGNVGRLVFCNHCSNEHSAGLENYVTVLLEDL